MVSDPVVVIYTNFDELGHQNIDPESLNQSITDPQNLQMSPLTTNQINKNNKTNNPLKGPNIRDTTINTHHNIYKSPKLNSNNLAIHHSPPPAP
jgi:hypothetical protein